MKENILIAAGATIAGIAPVIGDAIVDVAGGAYGWIREFSALALMGLGMFIVLRSLIPKIIDKMQSQLTEFCTNHEKQLVRRDIQIDKMQESYTRTLDKIVDRHAEQVDKQAAQSNEHHKEHIAAMTELHKKIDANRCDFKSRVGS